MLRHDLAAVSGPDGQAEGSDVSLNLHGSGIEALWNQFEIIKGTFGLTVGMAAEPVAIESVSAGLIPKLQDKRPLKLHSQGYNRLKPSLQRHRSGRRGNGRDRKAERQKIDFKLKSLLTDSVGVFGVGMGINKFE